MTFRLQFQGRHCLEGLVSPTGSPLAESLFQHRRAGDKPDPVPGRLTITKALCQSGPRLARGVSESNVQQIS